MVATSGWQPPLFSPVAQVVAGLEPVLAHYIRRLLAAIKPEALDTANDHRLVDFS
jgi:hypothetical protein